MPSKHAITIDLGRNRLRALHAQREGGMLRVKQVLLEDLPNDLNRDDAQQFGAFVRDRLKAAGLPRSNATLALARSHVALKRLKLPTTDKYELPQMTRLAMQRELPFDTDEAVIDYVPLRQGESNTIVLAVAVPQSILDSALKIAKAAGLRLSRVSLRSMGSALLLRHLGEDLSGSIFAVDITGETVEFCVIDDGVVRFSRAAEVPQDDDADALREVVLTETRRTWMSYRIGEESREVRKVVVMGDRRIGNGVTEALSKMLNVEAEFLQHHPLVKSNGHDMDRVWPLAGLMLEAGHEADTIDFANPRRAPDRRADQRKRMLYAAGVLLVMLLGFWTFANRQLQALEHEVQHAQQRAEQLYPDYVRVNRDMARLRHIELWESADVQWLDHLLALGTKMPAPDQVVLDGWAGALDTGRGAQVDRRTREWSIPKRVTINLSGEASNRSTADAFRAMLVQDELYDTSSAGADAPGGRRLPFGFSYRLRTNVGQPELDEAEHDEKDEDDSHTEETLARYSAAKEGSG